MIKRKFKNLNKLLLHSHIHVDKKSEMKDYNINSVILYKNK